jgi:hypothetical protein
VVDGEPSYGMAAHGQHRRLRAPGLPRQEAYSARNRLLRSWALTTVKEREDKEKYECLLHRVIVRYGRKLLTSGAA